MEEKNDRLPQEIPVEATDDAVLERLWADQPGAVSWKRKSPFGQPVSAAAPVSPTAPATPAAPQAEAVPEPPAPVEAAPPAPVTPPVEAVLQTAPPVVEEPQPPVEAPGDEKEPWPLEGTTVSWKRKSPFGQPVPAAAPVSPTAPATPAAPQAKAVPEPPASVEAAPPALVTPPVEAVLQTAPPVVEEPQPPVEAAPPAPVTPPVEAVLQTAPPVVKAPQPPQVQPPEPVMKTEVRPAKQGGLWGTKSRTPVISGAVSGGVFGSGSQRTEKERPTSLWGKEKALVAGKGYGSSSGSVWGKHAGQGSNPPAAGGTTWGKKAPAGERVCPQCSTPNPADARFCCMCRASLQEKTCLSCGKVIAVAQARYCPFCGADL